jgi:glutaredoxin
MAEVKLILYGRDGCHLCHDMLDHLKPIQDELDFQLEIIDIDKYPDLVARYDALIPVLVHDDVEICHYFLDMERLRSILKR